MAQLTTEKLKSDVEELIQKCLHLVNSNPKEAYPLAKKAVRIAKKIGSKGLEAYALTNYANVLRFFDASDELHVIYTRIADIVASVHEEAYRARAYRALGVYCRKQGDMRKSFEYFFEAIAIFEKIGEIRQFAFTLDSLGALCNDIGQYDDALRYMFKALGLLKERDDKYAEMRLLGSIANIYAYVGDYQTALDYHAQSLALTKVFKDKAQEAITLTNIGDCQLQLQHYAEAEKTLLKALRIKRQFQSKERAENTLLILASLYNKQQRYDKSLQILEGIIANTEEWANRAAKFKVHTIITLAEAYKNIGEPERAITHLQIGVDLIDGSEFLRLKLDLCSMLSTLYSEAGMYKEAFQHKILVEDLKEQLVGAERMRAVRKAEAASTLEQLQKQQHVLEERALKAEEEAKLKEQQLHEMTASLNHSVKTLREVEEKIKPYLQNTDGETRALAESIYQGLSKTMRTQLKHAPVQYLDSDYQEFIQRLHISYPKLTATEIKVCILIKLSYSNKQIGDVLNVSDLTVKTHRARIRKKMNLHPQENLLNVLMGI